MPTFNVSLPKSWPWDQRTFLGVGTVTKEPRPVELELPIARHLAAKGLVVDPSPDPEPEEPAEQPAKGRKGGKG
ncbi:MAG: hypothetical protein ACOY3Y_03670 [Acidobacteriota bacterium]